MIRNKAIYPLIAFSLLYAACSNDDKQLSDPQEVKIQASVTEKKAATRADKVNLTNGSYYLYLPLGSFNDSEQNIQEYTCTDGLLSTDLALYWDDLKAAANRDETTFYLTSTTKTSFDDITTDDILWGKTEKWLGNLTFNMQHCMSQLSIVLVDNSIAKDLGFDKAKVSLKSGLIRKIESFDFTTGEVTTASDELREIETILLPDASTKTDGVAPTITLPLGIVPPQAFAESTKLEITTEKFVFTVDLPTLMKDEGGNDTDIELRPGEHLTIEISLTEEKIDFTAKLVDWKEKTADPIEVTRVFNISNWNELKDLMLAINTGYTFKGMVVRLKDHIDIKGQVSLGNEDNPFEGIFDGNGFTLKNIGAHDNLGNKGGFFGITKGATLQNITIITPEISTGENGALGGLVDKAVDTTIFNCAILRDNEHIGLITGKNDYVGGMVGIGLGRTTLNYCSTIVEVSNDGHEYVGGLIGYSEGTITRCSSQGAVTTTGSDFVGGLAGYTSNNVLHCYAWGDVSGSSKVGGLIGFVDGSASNSYSSGKVSATTNDFGGLFGNLGFNGTAKYCFWYNPGSVAGTGSATLDASCKSFSIQDDQSGIIDDLNGEDNVWGLLNDKQAIFN